MDVCPTPSIYKMTSILHCKNIFFSNAAKTNTKLPRRNNPALRKESTIDQYREFLAVVNVADEQFIGKKITGTTIIVVSLGMQGTEYLALCLQPT